MSRIGKLPITVPGGVDIKIDGQQVTVKGPKGELSLVVAEPIRVALEDGQVLVTRPDDERASRALHGLTRTLINNDIVGVTEGYAKQLEVVGTGYRVQQKGAGLELALGFSHEIKYIIPAGITVTVDKQTIVHLAGADKQMLGQVAAEIRRLRPPEPYKGKGIKYSTETVRRKEGKKK